MGTIRRPVRRAAAVAVAAVLISACTPDTSSSEGDPEADDSPIGTVTVPPERLTPFCEAMIGLSDQLETDPPDDIEALIIETYLDIEDEVPPEIAPDFAAVLAGLQGEPVPIVDPDPAVTAPAIPDEPTATSVALDTAAAGDDASSSTAIDDSVPTEGSDPSDEGYLPSDDPAVRLDGYVDFACRDTINNPGPPATQPLDDIAPPTIGS